MEEKDSVAAILLASGFSERFGERNKLLVPFRGKPLARYTIDLAVKFGFSGGIFFIASLDEVASLAVNLSMVTVIKNNSPEKGLRESVALGVEAASRRGASYYLFFPCDMPLLDVATVQRILDERKKGCIVEPRFRKRPGNPCLFSADFKSELLSLGEDEAPWLIKASHPELVRLVEITNPLILEDIDDEETLQWIENTAP